MAGLGLNQTSYAEISIGTGPAAETIKVWGKIGTLTFLGLTPAVSPQLGQNGVDRLVNRKGHRRSRWLGDIVKVGVQPNQAISQIYPSRRGSAVPGKPVKIVNLNSNTSSGAYKAYTVQVDGNIGSFIEYLDENRLPFEAKVIGPTGARYIGTLPPAA